MHQNSFVRHALTGHSEGDHSAPRNLLAGFWGNLGDKEWAQGNGGKETRKKGRREGELGKEGKGRKESKGTRFHACTSLSHLQPRSVLAMLV